MGLSEINFAVLVASLIVASTPLVLAALGELVVEKSGVLNLGVEGMICLLYTSPSPRDLDLSRMPSSA